VSTGASASHCFQDNADGPCSSLRPKHRWRFRRLVLLGDIFDDLNFTRLKKHAWELVSLFRQITDEESNAELIWLLGNHDLELAEIMQHLVGMKVYREYEWEVGGRRFLAMHGDQFDKWIMNYPSLVVDIPCWLYDMIQRFDGPKQRISRYVKNKSKVWLRINERVAQGIIDHAGRRQRRIDAAFCGHTHIAESIEFKQAGMWYYNTGCWTGKQAPTFAAINHAGEVQIREFHGAARTVALAG